MKRVIWKEQQKTEDAPEVITKRQIRVG